MCSGVTGGLNQGVQNVAEGGPLTTIGGSLAKTLKQS